MQLNNVLHIPDRGAGPHAPVSFVLPENVAGVVKLGSIAPAPVDWLWPGRIPLGRLTLLVGDSGLGKSLLTLEVAARVTRGDPLPGGTPPSALRLPPSSVVLLTAEDDLADTVRPRLEALDADCNRVFAIPFAAHFGGDDERDAPDSHLRRDLKRLRTLLDALPDCRLVIVDPVSAYLAGSDNSASQVRGLLAPLSTLAHERRLAVVAVSHLRKKDGAAIYRASGSLAFINASRAAWLVQRDPDDYDRRLLVPLKSNLAGDNSSLAFSIRSSTGGPPVVHWSTTAPPPPPPPPAEPSGPAPTGRPSRNRDDAAHWLRQALATGARASLEIEEEARSCGFTKITLRRAFRALGGQAVRVGFGALGEWYWRLPGIGDQNPKSSHDHLWRILAKDHSKPEARV